MLDGEKTWISNGGIADFYVVFARTGEARRQRAASPPSSSMPARPGFSIAERIDVIAPHPLARLRFDDCRIPAIASCSAQPARASRSRCATLDVFRTSVAAAALGFARRALDEALQARHHARHVRQTLADFQLTQATLAQMATDDRCRRAADLPRRLAARPGQARVTREAAMAKLTATESAQRVIDAAVQMFGGLGVVRGAAGRTPVPRDPRAAHLRRRDRSAATDHRARAAARGKGFTSRGVRPMSQEIR